MSGLFACLVQQLYRSYLQSGIHIYSVLYVRYVFSVASYMLDGTELICGINMCIHLSGSLHVFLCRYVTVT